LPAFVFFLNPHLTFIAPQSSSVLTIAVKIKKKKELEKRSAAIPRLYDEFFVDISFDKKMDGAKFS